MLDKDVVLTTLVLYKVLLVLIGIWAQRRVNSEQDFFLASGQLGPWVAAVSYCASSASAWTLLGMSGLAFSIGLSALWVAAGAVLGCVFSWVFLAPRVMATAQVKPMMSATEFIALGTQGRERQRIVALAASIILVFLLEYIPSPFLGARHTLPSPFRLSTGTSHLPGAGHILLSSLPARFWPRTVAYPL